MTNQSDPDQDPDAATLPPAARAVADHSESDYPTLAPPATGDLVLHGSASQTVKYFGDYELLSEIARGGMGVVYKARQVNLNRLVALKMILAGQLASDEDVKRFYTEAEAAAALEHPGIVPIFEIGQHNDQHFFSMGFVDGGSLADKIKEGPLPSKEAASYTKKVAEAIAYAHSKGVIHRDLKPANILLDRNDEPKVTDFGLARRTESNSDLTRTGAVMGTPSYMPPEQAAGRTDQVGPLADVYSLGAILYCLLTGRPPFQASNPLDTLMQVMEREPVSVTTLNPAAHRDLETICHKCLQKDPAKRYASAQELADDLGRWLSGEPIQARAVSSSERAWRWVKRHKAVSASVAATAAAVLIGSAVSVWFGLAATREATRARNAEKKANESTHAAQTAEANAFSANDKLSQAKHESDRTLYARTVSLAYQQWFGNNINRSENLLNKTDFRFRNWEWDFVKRLCSTEHRTLAGHAGIPSRIQMTADGRYLVSLGVASSGDQNIYVWDFNEGVLRKRLSYHGLAISDDAQYVAVKQGNDGPVQVVNILTEERMSEIPSHAGGTNFADFSSDGSQLVTTGPDKTIRIWNTSSGEKTHEILQEERTRVLPLSFCENDLSLISGTDQGTVQVIEIATGSKSKEILDSGSVGSQKVFLSPDSRLLASPVGNLVRLFDYTSGSPLGTLRGHEGDVLSLAFHPTESRLVSSSRDGTVRVWDLEEFREVTRFRGHKAGIVYGVFDVIFSKDGKWIISGGADTTIKIWKSDAGDRNLVSSVKDTVPDPDPNQEKDWLVASRDWINDVDFSEDGRWIATASKDGNCRVYDRDTRGLTYTFDRHQQSVGAVAFHPNGKWIASGEGGLVDSRAGKIFVWNMTDGELLHTLEGHTGPISSLQFSPDGQRLYSSTGSQVITHRGEVIAWKLDSSTVEWKIDDITGVRGMDASRDGNHLAVAVAGGQIWLYDAASGSLTKKIGNPNDVFFCVEFSPDSKHVVGGTATWRVALFDVESGRSLWEQNEHSGAVFGVAFHPSGQRLASASIDRSAKLWDAQSGDVLLELAGDAFELFGVEFGPDGKTLACYGQAPYVTLRDAVRYESSETTESDWPIIFEDDFERSELGEQWTAFNGGWEIEEGAAKGTLASIPTILGFSATTMIAKAWIPSMVSIEYDAWAPKGLVFETKLHGHSTEFGAGSLMLGQSSPFNLNRPGSAIILQSSGSFREVASTGPRDWFQPMHRYRLKSVRQNDRWETLIDGEPILETAVPAEMWLPTLHIQGSFADPGTTFYIDNVVVRAPKETAAEIAAIALEYDLRQELKLRALVEDAIASKQDINEEIRRMALRFALLRNENVATRKQMLRGELLQSNRSESAYLAIAKVLEQDARLDDTDWEVQQLLAAAHYRAGQYQQAKEAATTADILHRKSLGMSHPISVAILALFESKLKNAPEAQRHQDDLRDLMRSRYWSADDSARAWSAQAYENILPSPRDEQRSRDEEEIRRITFEPQQKALCDHSFEEYFSTFAEDAVQIDGRSPVPTPYDVEFPIERWKEAQRVFGRSAPLLNARFVRNHTEVKLDGDKANLRGIYTFSLPVGYWRWQSDEQLRRTSDGWKIQRRRHGVLETRFGDNLQFSEETDWASLDDAIVKAKQEGEDIRLVAPLVQALHVKESFELLKRLAEQPEAPAGVWSGLAEQAYSMADADEMLRAGGKAVELDPKIQGYPFLRSLAFERYLPSEPIDVGQGISVMTPTYMTNASRLDFNVPGRVLSGWYPSDRSALLVFHRADFLKEGETLEGEMNSLAELFRKSFSATIHRQRLTEIDGFPACELTIEGFGNGRGMTPGAQGNNKGTVQRWVGILRDKELIGLLVTSTSDEFDQRNTEFEEWLKRVKIQKQSPSTE
jgi:eukaryotic-like serine/threonine-protein kinase